MKTSKRTSGKRKPGAFDVESFLHSVGVARTMTEFDSKARLFAQGDPCKNIMYIQKGGVKLSVVSKAGKEAVVVILGQSDFLGEGSLAGQPLRMATAKAVTAATVLVIDKKEMFRVLHAEHALSDRFIAYMLERNIRTEADLVDQLFNSSEKRLARTLLLLARYGSAARRAALFGAATAVVWSVDAALMKQTVDELAHSGLPGLLTHWPLYAMIATGVLGTILLQAAYAVGPLAASQAPLLIVDPLASITLGIELFHEQLRTGPGYVFGAVVSLAVLGAGVVMLSIWAPPVMKAENLARLPGRARPGADVAPHRVPV